MKWEGVFAMDGKAQRPCCVGGLPHVSVVEHHADETAESGESKNLELRFKVRIKLTWP